VHSIQFVIIRSLIVYFKILTLTVFYNTFTHILFFFLQIAF